MVWDNILCYVALYSDASLNISLYFLDFDSIKHLIPFRIPYLSHHSNLSTTCDVHLIVFHAELIICCYITIIQKLRNLKQQIFIFSQSLWVRNPGVA